LSFDKKLKELEAGDSFVDYLNQDNEAKQKYVYELRKLRDEIANSNLNNLYREDFLFF